MRRFWSLALIGLTACGEYGGAEEDLLDEHDPESEPFDDLSNELLAGTIDCSQRAGTGYRSGAPFSITLVTVDGRSAEVATANAYWVMQQAAFNAGVRLRIVSGFRSQS